MYLEMKNLPVVCHSVEVWIANARGRLWDAGKIAGWRCCKEKRFAYKIDNQYHCDAQWRPGLRHDMLDSRRARTTEAYSGNILLANSRMLLK